MTNTTKMLTIGVIKECATGERRVALDPSAAIKLAANVKIIVEQNAGKNAGFEDSAYNHPNISIGKDQAAVLKAADIIVAVAPPDASFAAKLKKGQILVGFIDPYRNADAVHALVKAGVTSLAMELIPRISRAQSMDALSSQAGISGYKCAIIAANLNSGYFPMLTTAAGTIRPAKVVVIGAGVAGLQAIATAKRLGAVVEAYDIRPDAKEQVESLGAKLIDTGVNAVGEGGYARPLTDEEQQQQAHVLAKHLSLANAVISTAALPGRPAPKIISQEMVANMKAGAVIVDMAAETGGNCALSQPGETIVTDNGVKIAAPVNIPSSAPVHASEMYAKNISNLLNLIIDNGALHIHWDDDIIKGASLTREGELVHEHVKSVIGA